MDSGLKGLGFPSIDIAGGVKGEHRGYIRVLWICGAFFFFFFSKNGFLSFPIIQHQMERTMHTQMVTWIIKRFIRNRVSKT